MSRATSVPCAGTGAGEDGTAEPLLPPLSLSPFLLTRAGNLEEQLIQSAAALAGMVMKALFI